ncbi:MAG TPA: pilus assembly PilX N-terminal domain-containing protein [Thermoanaerobaculia bacterium]|nr:pilus assembly PilX N-terminal domain-containing protein [Thermoanaerobaculia bacterium]
MKRFARQRGAALILTVVVILVLSTLGLAMVAFTGTEERSAVVYRDTLQTRAVAEGGVRLVQMMFADPADRALVPVFKAGTTAGSAWDYYGTTSAAAEPILNGIGIFRADRSPYSPALYTGANNGFFRGPFSTDWGSVFGGTYSNVEASDKYDLKFNCINPADDTDVGADCWLDKINALIQDPGTDVNLNPGKIVDISFYGPPSVGGVPYGITTVRVTAEKYADTAETQVVAREVVEAVIGDLTKKPAVLGNGNVTFNINLCGDGCEQIHANGTITTGPVVGTDAGDQPIVTATGTATGGSGAGAAGGQPEITSPEINPWDLAYKPTTTSGLQKYYLLTAGPLDLHWNNDLDNDNISNAQTGVSAEPCGVNQLSLCEDYNLEYNQGTAGTPRAMKGKRLASDVGHMYKWDLTYNEWDFCDNTAPLSCGAGTPTFDVTPADDWLDPGLDGVDAAGRTDNADMPFNKVRVAKYLFTITGTQAGATVLIDGAFYKHGNMSSTMSVITAGSIHLHSSTTWAPALSNRVMWLSGRDIFHHSNCCAPNNQCLNNLDEPSYAGVMAAHEQYRAESQAAVLGMLISEHKVNMDDKVNSDTVAIYNSNGDHGSLCGLPDWPWSLPTKTAIFSMKSVP